MITERKRAAPEFEVHRLRAPPQRQVQSREFSDAEMEPPVTDPRDEVTRILRQIDHRADAAEELLPLVYEQLRAIAQRRMREERAGHTLQATALVHEAFVKLVGGGEGPGWESRAHFFRVAAEAMRRILIDHARKRKSVKRGGGATPIPLSVVDLAAEHDPAQIMALNEALETLESEDARAAEVVKLRFFAGLSVEETAEAIGISERTAMREWAFARARLYELLAVEE
jgi:RNA polymerase sigma factor (TIGR02999 family)